MKQATFKIGVFAIILNNDNEVLLAHRTDRDMWNLPGGKLEYGESPWEGVIREVKEETGLDVVVESVTGLYSKEDHQEIVFNFYCKKISGDLTLNEEADQLEYFDVKNIPENVSMRQLERIKDFFENMTSLFLKSQR